MFRLTYTSIPLYNCTMNIIVADASVLLCILLREVEWEKTAEAISGYHLIGPSSLPMEIGNSLSALVRRDLLKPEKAMEVWEAFLEVPVRIIETPVRSALQIAFAHKIYAYDAYVLALGEVEHADIATFDRSMIRIAKEIGIRILEV